MCFNSRRRRRTQSPTHPTNLIRNLIVLSVSLIDFWRQLATTCLVIVVVWINQVSLTFYYWLFSFPVDWSTPTTSKWLHTNYYISFANPRSINGIGKEEEARFFFIVFTNFPRRKMTLLSDGRNWCRLLFICWTWNMASSHLPLVPKVWNKTMTIIIIF